MLFELPQVCGGTEGKVLSQLAACSAQCGVGSSVHNEYADFNISQ